MQFTNYWQQFEHTGRVEDYLKYLQSAGKEKPLAGAECKSPMRAVATRRWTAGRKDVQTLTPGRMDHAGIPVCNGNCIKTDTFR